jgi:hypothetical protein
MYVSKYCRRKTILIEISFGFACCQESWILKYGFWNSVRLYA